MTRSSKLTPEILYERLLRFAKRCLDLVKKLPKTPYNMEYGRQLIRSSSSPASNYIEAMEASSKRDFIHKLKICRKESKESIQWLRLIAYANKDIVAVIRETKALILEGREFIKIFTSSILTAEKNRKIKK
jgi:four helix bundle protein